MESIMAAVCQAGFGTDKGENRACAAKLVHEAAAASAKLVVLPEMACWWGPLERMPEHAEPLNGRWVTFLRELASELGVYIVGGSFPRLPKKDEAYGSEKKVFNSSPVIGPAGELIGVFDKLHLFDVDMENGPRVKESKVFLQGRSREAISLPFGTLRVGICYDLRFPESFRCAPGGAGSEIIALPSAFHRVTGEFHWRTLARARAVENLCYFLAADQCGTGPQGYDSYGGSLVVGPWGAVMAEAGGLPVVLTVELDSGRLEEIRRRLPCLQHVRTDFSE